MSEEQLRSIAESLGIKGAKKMDRAGLGFAILDQEAVIESQKPAEVKPAAKKRGRPKKTAAPAAPATKRVAFTITAAADVPVFLAGTFNDWDAESIRLEGKDGVYATELDLAPGTYEYKFIVNGFWTMDPDPTRDWVPNGLGTLNSVVVVK